jgi:ATP-dependent 26S proteasome regulatory subunit
MAAEPGPDPGASVPSDSKITALRQALSHTPDNLTLRQMLAEALQDAERFDEAEKEFRAALALAPDSAPLKLCLAKCFFRQGKNSHALVVVEDLVKAGNAAAEAFLLHAHLLFRAGDAPGAVRAYKHAILLDPNLADRELAARLGVGANPDTSEVIEGRVRATWEGEPESAQTEVERPTISFHDVGGMDPIKEEIRLKIIYPLLHPEMYRAYAKKIGGGILMYGPPGCGKTYLARATAGEIKAGFIAVGISDVLDMWIGNSEKNLHELFEQARRNRPCVLFFDEVDALGASRSDMRHSGGRHLINQFLAEMDGVQSSNEGVLILAATNAPWHLDSAFRRPGRFDRILFVPPPDLAARAAIVRLHLRGRPAGDIDYEHVAKRTDHFSGADLKAVVDVAVENKLREAMRAGAPQPLTAKDLLTAAATVKPSTREWFATARNYALYSNQGGIYDDILGYLKLK